jgi:hypothetical protein
MMIEVVGSCVSTQQSYRFLCSELKVKGMSETRLAIKTQGEHTETFVSVRNLKI